jgi:ACS family pantothenate transporter-like MFS transporter
MKTSLLEWPTGTPDITTHDVMKDYIQDIARQYNVHDHVRYRTTVLKIEKLEDVWKVTTKSRRRDSALSGNQPATNVETFDAVIVATGHYHAPRIPDIPGLSTLKKQFPGRISHSKGYRGAEAMTGKKVLLIGTGASAVDIARDAAPLAKTIYHSWRAGKFDVPLSMFPEKVVHVGEVVRIESPTVKQEVDMEQPLPAQLWLADGRLLCDIDVIILCTGYHISLPLLAKYHDDDMPVDQASEEIIVTDGTMYHNLHKDIFYIPDSSLIFIGVPYFTANFSLFDFQAQAVAAALSGHASLPSQTSMREEYRRKLEAKGAGKQFHSLKGSEVEYVHELLAWVNPQLKVNGREPLKGHAPEWLAAKEEQMERFRRLLAEQSTTQQDRGAIRHDVL